MTTPDAGQRLIEDSRVSELLALHKLMEYADAWRTQPGCSCGQCQLCEARELSADDADAIAAILHESIKTIERLRGVENELAQLKEWAIGNGWSLATCYASVVVSRSTGAADKENDHG